MTERANWVKQLAEGSEEMLNPGAMLRQHPVAKIFVDQDHLVRKL